VTVRISFGRSSPSRPRSRPTNLQVLAIVTTIFLPATLVSGIFGMNVMGLPLTQNPHGFVWSMLILIGSSALVLWLLKRSGIFGR